MKRHRLLISKKYWPILNQTIYDVVTQINLNNYEEALSVNDKSKLPAFMSGSAVANLTEMYRKDAEDLYNQGEATFRANVILTAILSFAAVSLSLLLAIVLTRSITRPLLKGVGMMKELSLGHFGRRLKMSRRDEIGALAESMDVFADDLQNNVVGTMKKIAAGDLTTEVTPKDSEDEIGPALKDTIDSLRALMADMKKVYREQKAGDMDYYASIDQCQGAYKEVLEAYNAAVKMHVDNMLKILGILTSYAEGDFVPVLEKLPGKQAHRQ